MFRNHLQLAVRGSRKPKLLAPSCNSPGQLRAPSFVFLLTLLLAATERADCAILDVMKDEASALASWTPEQIRVGQRWVEVWKLAGPELERIRRKEIRELDTYRTIAMLCGPADYTIPPRAPKPSSGLVEQQRWFMKTYNPQYLR